MPIPIATAAARQSAGERPQPPATGLSTELAALLQTPGGPIPLTDDWIQLFLVEATRLHVQLAAVASRLLAELLARSAAQDHGTTDRLLTADEAAVALGVNLRWIRRRARVLPFVRRISGKAIRISEDGLRRWVAARRTA